MSELILFGFDLEVHSINQITLKKKSICSNLSMKVSKWVSFRKIFKMFGRKSTDIPRCLHVPGY